MVGTMLQPPWNARIYRNRHGRGTRTPMFGTRLPRYRTRTGMFDDMVAAQVRARPASSCSLFRVWKSSQRMNTSPRISTKSAFLESEAPTKLELQLAVRDELVARIAELYGRRPEEIDPDWGL